MTGKKKVFSIFTAACALALPFSAVRAEGPCFPPLKGLPPAFKELRMKKGIVKARVSDGYFRMKAGEKKGLTAELSKAALEACGEKPIILDLSAGHTGELWHINNGSAVLIEKRSYAGMNAGGKTIKAGKWFASFGIQSIGGDYPSTGINLRFGTMLYKNKYDLALSYDYNQQNYSLLTKKAIGLSARKLFPLTPHGGYNLGVNLSRTDYYGETETDFKGLAGINIYLPGGTFDITYSMGFDGDWSVVFGYTVFIIK